MRKPSSESSGGVSQLKSLKCVGASNVKFTSAVLELNCLCHLIGEIHFSLSCDTKLSIPFAHPFSHPFYRKRNFGVKPLSRNSAS